MVMLGQKKTPPFLFKQKGLCMIPDRQ